MDIQRTIPIILDKNPLVDDTIVEFNRYQQAISAICFNKGHALRAFELQKLVYYQIATTLNSQARCSAIRAVASAYASAKSRGKPAIRPFVFRHPSALFLFRRDFSFHSVKTMSISTLQGRQRIEWRIPEHFQADFESAKSVDSLIISRGGAHLCITLEVKEPKGLVPVGIDLGVNNALVASTPKKILFVSGKKLSVANTKLRKVRSRLQSKLAGRKAQHQDTRSVVRVLKRLSHKHHNRNVTFCRQTAAQLCTWAPRNAVLVFEDLNFKPRSKKARMRAGTRRKLNQWFYGMMLIAVRNRAERQGLALDFVDPSFTSQLCRRCGLLGVRQGHQFRCACGHVEHADVNASHNIRSRFTALRSSGLLSISPEARASATGKSTVDG